MLCHIIKLLWIWNLRLKFRFNTILECSPNGRSKLEKVYFIVLILKAAIPHKNECGKLLAQEVPSSNLDAVYKIKIINIIEKSKYSLELLK